jgi:chitinase
MRQAPRRALRAGAIVAVAASLVAAVLVSTVNANAAGTVTATFVATSDWGTGHEVRVTVTNGTSAAVNTWQIDFDLPSGTNITGFWDADVTHTGTHWTAVKKSWAGPLAPGASFSWGYDASGPFRAPTTCVVNGSTCAGGTTPTTAPPTTSRPPTSAPPTTQPPTTAPPTSNPPTTGPPPPGGRKVLGYFVEWGVYARNYHAKNIATSGSVNKLTHINYAFGNVTNGQCAIGDSYADYDRFYTAAESVDGVADTWDAGVLRGSFNQLRKLKRLNPNLKVLWSFGGSARRRRTRPRSPTPATTWSRTRAGRTSSTASTSTGSTRTPVASAVTAAGRRRSGR